MLRKWDDIKKAIDMDNSFPLGEEPVIPWATFEKRVRRNNFLKFSLHTINIYIVSTFFALASVSGIVSYKYLKTKSELKKQQELNSFNQGKNNDNNKTVTSIDSNLIKQEVSNQTIGEKQKNADPVKRESNTNQLKNDSIASIPSSVIDTVVRIIKNTKIIHKKIIIQKSSKDTLKK